MFIFPFYQLYLVGNGIVGGINYLRHEPDYGHRERRFVRDIVYAEAKRANVGFILNAGDITANDGRRPSHWATFLRENRVENNWFNMPGINKKELALFITTRLVQTFIAVSILSLAGQVFPQTIAYLIKAENLRIIAPLML